MDVPCEMENDDEMTIVNRGHLAPTPDKGAEPWRRVSQGSGLVGEAGGRGGTGIQDLLCRAIEVTQDWEPEARDHLAESCGGWKLPSLWLLAGLGLAPLVSGQLPPGQCLLGLGPSRPRESQ